MKLYREESSPSVDLIVDTSASMNTGEAKRERTLDLVFFAVESALHAGCGTRCFTTDPRRPWPLESILAHQPPLDPTADFNLSALPFRGGSLRVLISDLLFPGDPDPHLTALAANRGRAVILSPFAASEKEPDWSGNMDLVDCEHRDVRKQHVSPALLDRYRAAYQRHFDLWLDASQRHSVRLARISTDGDLVTALKTQTALDLL